jgi:hypothetical protein
MNCQDISLAMDDRDIGALNEAQRREFDAHLETCPDCAQDWELHVRLAATRTPSLPADLLNRIESSLPVRGRTGGHHTSRRLVVIGAVVAFAAAAMLALHLMQTPTPAEAQTTALVLPLMPEPAPEPVEAVTSAAPAPVQPTQTPAKEGTNPPAQPTSLVAPPTVRVLPLQNQATGPSIAAVETFFAALLANLRGSNDIAVLAPDQPEPEFATAAVRIRVRGYGPAPDGKLTIEFVLESLQPDGNYKPEYVTFGPMDIAASCSGASASETTASCRSPLYVAEIHARSVRARLLRPDPALQRAPQIRLADQSLSDNERLTALSELRDRSSDAVVLGAVDLAKTATDPKMRAFTWNVMANVRNPELVAPVVEAMVRDPDANVRLQAMIVAAGFANDPRVRDGFVTMAQTDSSPMLRALGQRGIAGEEPWKKYIAASLKDTSRSDADRIEALAFELGRPVRMDLQGFLKDNDALPALSELLPRLGSDSLGRNTVFSLLGRLAPIEDAAITDLVLDVVSGNPGKLKPASSLVYMLGNMLKSQPDNARIRTVLEKISAEEPDPNLRQTIADLLKKP